MNWTERQLALDSVRMFADRDETAAPPKRLESKARKLTIRSSPGPHGRTRWKVTELGWYSLPQWSKHRERKGPGHSIVDAEQGRNKVASDHSRMRTAEQHLAGVSKFESEPQNLAVIMHS